MSFLSDWIKWCRLFKYELNFTDSLAVAYRLWFRWARRHQNGGPWVCQELKWFACSDSIFDGSWSDWEQCFLFDFIVIFMGSRLSIFPDFKGVTSECSSRAANFIPELQQIVIDGGCCWTMWSAPKIYFGINVKKIYCSILVWNMLSGLIISSGLHKMKISIGVTN
jgi:hypothetical protein